MRIGGEELTLLEKEYNITKIQEMITATIISDILCEALNGPLVPKDSSEGIAIVDWNNLRDFQLFGDVLIVDMDLSEQVGDNGRVLNSYRKDLRLGVEVLEEVVPTYLESGGSVVALMADNVAIPGARHSAQSSIDSFSWLYGLGTVYSHYITQGEPEIVTDNQMVEHYFGYAGDLYGINYDEGTDTEVLAQIYKVVNDSPTPVAISFNEYVNEKGVKRTGKGSVILFPPLRTIRVDPAQIASMLAEVGYSFVEGSERSCIIDPSDEGVELDDELIERGCIDQYRSDHFQSAVTNAFTVLEERIREKGGYDASKHGVNLIQEAFHHEEGPLSFGQTKAEREGVMLLYRGAFQTLRNPPSHRFLDDLDSRQARDIIYFVDLLLNLIDESASE